MKIPSRVRITSRVSYEVTYIERFENPDVLGECRYDSKQIVLRTAGQSEKKLFSTFVHESCHAMSFETPGLCLTETQVLALEKALMRVLRLNKLL